MKRVVLTALLMLTVSSCGYNRIQSLDEQVDLFESQIKVQLQRRADLIPNLVNTVRGFAEQEQAIFEAVTSARSRLGGAVEGGSLAEMAAANQSLNSALGRLLAIAEDNPEIQSNQNFRDLQVQLEGTENRISTARQDYNEAVQAYNSYIRRFPQILTAKMIGAEAREYFEVTDESATEVPEVEF
ncbi:MAG: LemA family protein [Gemmatimonadota bacterium]|nr:MAG: LemA family protein [Gemmatimonadota bacterium]